MILIGLIVIILSIIFGTFIIEPFAFIVLPSLLPILGCVFGGLLMTYKRNLFTAIKGIFSKKIDSRGLELSILVLEKAKSFSIAAGSLVTLIGFTSLFSNLEDKTMLFPGISVAYLSLFYGLFISYAIFLPLIYRLKRKLNSQE